MPALPRCCSQRIDSFSYLIPQQLGPDMAGWSTDAVKAQRHFRELKAIKVGRRLWTGCGMQRGPPSLSHASRAEDLAWPTRGCEGACADAWRSTSH